jgi:predicted Holliday junction resolvase-like endonuclease
MLFEDLILPVIISLVIGFTLGFFYVKAQITAIENTYRAELERWKVEVSGEIRSDAVNRSRSTLKGKIAEQLAPVLPGFLFNPADARFIGSPIDYIIFDGLTEVADDKKRSIRIVFMDVKQGGSTLTRTQRVIKKAIEDKSVSWETFRIDNK